jgi:FixJ family two-component response regulator
MQSVGASFEVEGSRVSQSSLISVIDDDRTVQSALVGLIESTGRRALGFDSAEDFLRSKAMRTYACVITDIQMPGMSGVDLKRYLTAHNIETPVIMITAHAELGLRERAIESGAFCFLQKPFEADDLIHCMERALKTHR